MPFLGAQSASSGPSYRPILSPNAWVWYTADFRLLLIHTLHTYKLGGGEENTKFLINLNTFSVVRETLWNY